MTQEITSTDNANVTTETVVQEPNVPQTLEDAIKKLSELEGIVKAAENGKAALQRKLHKFEKEVEEKEAVVLAEQGKWKELYEKQQTELVAKENAYKEKSVKSAVTNALKDAQASDVVTKLFDFATVTFTENGEVDMNSITEQLDAIKKDAPMLFGSVTQTGANPAPVVRPNGQTPVTNVFGVDRISAALAKQGK